MQPIRATLFLTLFCAVAATAARATNYEYDWTGGRTDFAGKIVLDSNSSSAGTLADIVSAQITISHETLDFDPNTAIFLRPEFAWNSSQITDMWINWSVPGVLAGFGENFDFNGVNFVGAEDTESGVTFWIKPALGPQQHLPRFQMPRQRVYFSFSESPALVR